MIWSWRDSQARFTIYDTTGPEHVPVGTCELVIQHRWRNAEFFILLGSGHRAKGIGTEATRLTLDYAFHITNLRNVDGRHQRQPLSIQRADGMVDLIRCPGQMLDAGVFNAPDVVSSTWSWGRWRAWRNAGSPAGVLAAISW